MKFEAQKSFDTIPDGFVVKQEGSVENCNHSWQDAPRAFFECPIRKTCTECGMVIEVPQIVIGGF